MTPDPKLAKGNALTALASARLIVDSPEGWTHEIQIEQLRVVLAYCEKQVAAIPEVQRLRPSRARRTAADLLITPPISSDEAFARLDRYAGGAR